MEKDPAQLPFSTVRRAQTVAAVVFGSQETYPEITLHPDFFHNLSPETTSYLAEQYGQQPPSPIPEGQEGTQS